MTRVEIQSGTDATLSESLFEVFQLCERGEARGWCVGPGPDSSGESAEAASDAEAASERRRG